MRYKVKFQCPSSVCKGTILQEVAHQVTLHSEIIGIDADSKWLLFGDRDTMDDGEVECYQCAMCGLELAEQDYVIRYRKDLLEWLQTRGMLVPEMAAEHIQAVRLLAELRATFAIDGNAKFDAATSMGVSVDDLTKMLDDNDKLWEEIKGAL